jgi:hypothetical protein
VKAAKSEHMSGCPGALVGGQVTVGIELVGNYLVGLMTGQGLDPKINIS